MRLLSSLLLCLSLGLFTSSCFVDDEQIEDDSENNSYIPISGGQPNVTTRTTSTSANGTRTLTVCNTFYGYETTRYACYQETNRVWLSECQNDQCNELRVNVHYMLTEDLGTGNTVIVEAFDNHMFQGSPSSVLRITNFDASRAGTHSEDFLLLDSGEYYIRAYISNEDTPPTPYQYGNMDIISDQPFGLYGALSDATRVTIGDGTSNSVNIYMDKLFKTPGMEDPTNAHARVVVNIDPSYNVPLAQEVLIQLHNELDFDFHPAYEFSVASETLKVSGAEGRSEFVSGQLEPGDYFVFVWLDLSGNGFWDAGEPNQTYEIFGETGRIHVERDKTVSIELNLE